MKLSEWTKRYQELDETFQKLQTAADLARDARDQFTKETIGFAPRDTATLAGTVNMVSAIVRMSKEEA